MSVATRIDRRKVLQAGAWTVPVISVAAAAPTLAASATRTVTGTMTWGVKQSFRSYIINMPISQGTITLSGGVTQTGNAASPFVWPAGSGTVEEDGTVTVQYGGTVRFLKHEGDLDVTIAEPLLVVSPDGTGTISVTYTSTDGETTNPVLALLNSVNTADDGSVVTVSNGALDPDADVSASVLAESGVVVFSGVVYGNYTEFYDAGASMNAFETTLTEG